MPNNWDFSEVKNIKKMKVNPDGWVNPLLVEYGEGVYGSTPAFFWRVDGTKHTFVIPMVRMDYLSSGNYAEHFKKVLEWFKEDYKEWSEDEFNTEWMQRYKEQFEEFIII